MRRLDLVAGLIAAAFLPRAALAKPWPPAPGETTPGPSKALFDHPYYRCLANLYVSTTGSDTNPGTQALPLATLQHANDVVPPPGTCINVAPGTYAAGVLLSNGGNLAAPTGYVVYRCQALDACTITADGDPWNPVFAIKSAYGPNYIVIDGFTMAASEEAYYGVAIDINNNPDGGPLGEPSAHHVWMLNNIIHGYGQAGIGTGEADWLFALHNTAYNNANVTCDAQGSGIGYVVAKVTPNYTPTKDDLAFAPFHQVIGYNISYNNIITQCGNAQNPYDTDGNGIILDTFNGSGVDNVLYTAQTLVTGNVTFDNGGKGIEVFRSDYITVTNNSAYNNNLDPWNAGFPRGEIHNGGAGYNTYLNNIAYSVPAGSPSDPRCQGADYDIQPAPCPLMANVALFGADEAGITDIGNSWSNNITEGGAPPWGWGPDGNVMLGNDAAAFTCTENLCETDPLFASVQYGVGDFHENFALQPASPAIGEGLPEPYLPVTAVDAGACPHTRKTCK
jgi:parallel beta-helix repeat protein